MSRCIRRYLLTLLAALSGLCVASVSDAAEKTFKLGHASSVTSHSQIAAVELQRVMKERSGGRLDVGIFPNSQLGDEKELLEAILLGSVDMTKTSTAVLSNFIPEFNVLNMPFVFQDLDHLGRATDNSGPIFAKMRDISAKKGFRLLGVLVCCNRHFMTHKPINSMADLKGLKLRAIQNPVHIATFNAFGANATAIAFSELYGALQTRVVDGGDAANTNYYDQKLYEIVPNWAMVSWLVLAEALVMSEKNFQALSAADQKIVMDSGTDLVKYSNIYARDLENERLAKIREQRGVTITTPDRAPFIAASEKIYDQFLKTPDELEILKMIRATK